MIDGKLMNGERINYLSVALRARGAIKTLKSRMASQQGFLSLPNNELQEDLHHVIRLLRAARIEPLHNKLDDESQYSRFEDIETLSGVTESLRGDSVLQRLEKLVNGGCNQEDLRVAIRLFAAIERQALYHYQDPSWSPAF